MARFVALTSPGSMAAMWRASRRAVASRSAAGTTRLIMPISRARAALSLSSPMRMISLATLGPTIQGSSITTMPAPNFSSGSPKKASSAAIVRSQASASSQAPGEAGPAHGGNGGLRAMPEAHDGIEVLAQDRAPLRNAGRPPLHLLLEVEARGERGAGAAHDDRPHRGVALRLVQGLADLGQHGLVEGVGALGAVQRDARNAVQVLEHDGRKLHVDSSVAASSYHAPATERARGALSARPRRPQSRGATVRSGATAPAPRARARAMSRCGSGR